MPETKIVDEEIMKQWPPEAVVRFQHAGEWVAWSSDFERFVAAASTRDEAIALARAAGEERPVCEWIDPDLPRLAGSLR
jgi:hypothetical protein